MTVFLFIRNKLIDVLPANSLRRRFATGAFWSVAAAFIWQGSRLVASFVVARILGKTGFGEFGMIQSTMGMFGIFAGLGLGLTVTKHVAEFRSTDPVYAGRVIALSSTLALISGGGLSITAFLASSYLANYVINAQHLTMELRVASGLLLFDTIVLVQISILSGLEAFKTIAKLSLLRGLLNFPLLIVSVYFWGLLGAVCSMVITIVLACLVNYIFLSRELRRANITVSYRSMRSELSVLWRFSLPAFLGTAIIPPVRWGANVLLANRTDGYAELGIFVAATQFEETLDGLGRIVGRAFLPMLASRGTVKSDRFERANILVSWLIGVFLVLPLISFPSIMGLLFGSQYAEASARRTFVLVMYYTCIVMYKQGLNRVLVAKGLMWWGLISNIMWSMVLLGSFLFLKQFGAIGLALAFAMAHALNTVCFIPLYKRRKLVPRSTIVSLEAGAIWLVITGLSLLSILHFPLLMRSIALLLSALALLIAFSQLFLSRKVAQLFR